MTVWRYTRGHVQTLRSSAMAPHLQVKRNDFSGLHCRISSLSAPFPNTLPCTAPNASNPFLPLATPPHPGQLSQTVCLANQLGHSAGPVTASLTGGASPDRCPPDRALPVITQPIVLLYFSLGRLPPALHLLIYLIAPPSLPKYKLRGSKEFVLFNAVNKCLGTCQKYMKCSTSALLDETMTPHIL